VLPLPALEAVAGELVPDEDEASAATKVWLEAAVDAGLLSSLGDRYRLDAADVDVQRQEALWNSAASLLAQVKARNAPDVPVYVRTGDAWGAWAYALQTQAPSESRTIDNGDILSRSIETPKREFALVYEDPADIRVDRNEPAMQELWRKAGEKFVVSAPGDDDEEVPPDFVQLPLVPPDED
jgi:hypothetical protein